MPAREAVPIFQPWLYLAQVLVNELHGYRALTYTRRDALYRTVADIAHGKQAGNVCFQQEGIPVQSPSLGALAVPDEVGAGQDKAAFVALHQFAHPIGPGQCSNKDEHGACRYALYFVGVRTEDRNFLQVRVTMRFGNAGMLPELDVGCLFDLVNQVL